MAKQTFTTGQVLTAAQMTSLQQTAMGGGPATAKTADYVLVAADAGTTVAMNAAGATTITVNTGLFAAGDTVFIQNLGAGACTVTAGTATVATAGSLILPQNDAGILYFTSASAAIFYDYIQVGATSPLTTKGDLYTYSTSDTRLGVGADGTTLVADSAEATGLKWAAPAGGNPAGTVIFYAANAAPTGFLKSNGAAVSRSTYADLFTAIGTTFGVGDGSTTFNVPDLRGYFPRGWADDGSIDSGRTFGTTQSATTLAATTGTNRPTHNVIANSDGTDGTVGIGDIGDDNTRTATRQKFRPVNIALLACIKF
jgi:microcystin-dependent protein